MTERYIYRCVACGNTGEIDFSDGEAATGPRCCGVPVILARDTGPLFWLEGGDGSPSFVEPPRAAFEPGQSLYELQWLYELIDGENLLKPGRVVIPRKAAVALCGGDHREADPLSTLTAAMRNAYEDLHERFKNADPKVGRSFADWRAFAKKEKLPYHPHIDAMMQANGFGQAIDKADATNPAKLIPVRQQQEEAILQVIVDLKYTATALPPNPAGQPGVRAEVKKLLVPGSLTPSAFRNTWQRLLDGERTAYAPATNPPQK